MIAAERETTVVATDEDEIVRISSAQRRHITKMRRNPAFTEVRTGVHDGTEWAEFTIPADQWSPATGAKRKVNMTPEARAAAAARLSAARKNTGDQ